jgi:hypothetical protein
MPFHFDKAEATAFASEDISGQRYGAHCTKLAKQGTYGPFRGIGGQVADKQFLQTCILAELTVDEKPLDWYDICCSRERETNPYGTGFEHPTEGCGGKRTPRCAAGFTV